MGGLGDAIAELFARVGADTKDFHRGMDQVDDRMEKSKGRLGSLGSSIGGFMGAAGKQAVMLGAAVGVAWAAAGVGLGKMVMMASSSQEALNKVRVVFGEFGGEIEEFSKTAAKNLGMSQSQALAAAGTFGNLFTAMKVGRPEATAMSKGLLQLSADLASFNDMDPTEVLDKLRAGLVGETEPLRALGVNLTAETVKAKAFAMGFREVNGELSAAAKAQASYALIMEQTGSAQGDYARTSTSMANALRSIKATFADIGVEIGTVFLPIAEQMLGWLAGKLPAAIEFVKGLNLVGIFKEWAAFLQDNVFPAFGLVGGAIGSLVPIAQDFVKTIVNVAQRGGELQDNFVPWHGTLSQIGVIIGQVGAFIKDNFLPGLRTLVDFVQENRAAQVALVAVLGLALAAFIALNAPILAVIAIVTGLISVIGYLTENWDTVRKAVENFMAKVSEVPILGPIVKAFVDTAVNAIDFLIETFKDMFALVKFLIEGNWSQAWSKAQEIFANAVELIIETLGSMGGMILGVLNDIPSVIEGALSGLGKLLLNIGREAIEGLISGIRSKIPDVGGIVRELADQIPDWAKSVLRMRSPSRVMEEVGKGVGEGLAQGIEGSTPLVASAAKNMAAVVQASMPSFAGFMSGDRAAAHNQDAAEEAFGGKGVGYNVGISGLGIGGIAASIEDAERALRRTLSEPIAGLDPSISITPALVDQLVAELHAESGRAANITIQTNDSPAAIANAVSQAGHMLASDAMSAGF